MRLRIAFVLLTTLQANGMSGIKPERWPINGLPPRRPFADVTIVRRRIEPQSCNHSEGVALTRVDGDPFARAALAVAAKFGRTQG